MMNRRTRKAVLAIDAAWIRKNCPGSPASDAALREALHKARYELTEATPEQRRESRAWLEARGKTRLYGMPFDPEMEAAQ